MGCTFDMLCVSLRREHYVWTHMVGTYSPGKELVV